MAKFAGKLGLFMRQSGMPLRRVASQAGIPHQTLYNWTRGTQPRWCASLPGNLNRLGVILGLTNEEITNRLCLAGCVSTRSNLSQIEEVSMNNAFRIPNGWFAGGDAPHKYQMGLDPTITYVNRSCVTIKAGSDPSDFGALSQMIKANAYRGKRLRFSAAVRSQNVENMAALFMRVGGGEDQMLAIDNMRNRPITGTTDWTYYTVVLDIYESAETIVFGIFHSLNGQIWRNGSRICR